MKTERTRLSETFYAVAAASVTFFVLGACLQSAYDANRQRKEAQNCTRIEEAAEARAAAAEKVVSLVENDNSDYFNDVLSGTDEYETYRKLRASCE